MEQIAKITVTMDRDAETGERPLTIDYDGDKKAALIGLAFAVNELCADSGMSPIDFAKLCMNARRSDTIDPTAEDESTDIEGTVRYELYQLKDGTPAAAVCRYMSYDWMQAHGHPIVPQNYERVYAGELERGPRMTLLEGLFRKFNLDMPADYPGRSMGVSDVVVLCEEGRPSAYYCDRVGFKEIEWRDRR